MKTQVVDQTDQGQTTAAVNCDYRMDRVDAGLKPACVTKCTTQALKFVMLQEVE